MRELITNVELQGPLSFARWPMIVLGAVLGAALLYAAVRILIHYIKIWAENKKKLEEAKKQAELEKPKVLGIDVIKANYLAQIESLSAEYAQGKLESRAAYEKLSSIFRNFVYEATGTPAHKYTLYDIKGLNNQVIYNLVNNYYTPEFARNEKGNIMESIEITKRAVSQWN